MPALMFDTCCGCIELRTGCLIIGYLQLVEEIILAVMVFLMLVVGSVFASRTPLSDTTSFREFGKEYFSSSTSYNFAPNHPPNKHELGVVLIVIGVILLLALALALAFTITLLVGVHKNKRGHVKAYMIYATIFLVLGIILFFVSLSSKNDAGSIIGNLISLALNIYLLLVVRSYYYKMDTNKPVVFRTA